MTDKKEKDTGINAYLLFLILILLILSENVLTIITRVFGNYDSQKTKKEGKND